MNTTKAKSNCWTCKDRKIGCDKTLPSCTNCAKAQRLCKGYGLKLSWPDKFDGRRKQKKYEAVPEASATSYYVNQRTGFTFLNSTIKDLEGGRVCLQDLVGPLPRSWSVTQVGQDEGLLLHYYDSVISRMITTIDDHTNGFRFELIPIALSSSDTSSRGLLEAMLALSSFHLGKQEEALVHKVKAIKSLSSSFQGGSASRIAQFSACMMLCVYSVFDASDTTWSVHLQGAKSLLQSASNQERSMPNLAFLASWLEYHDTFSAYSHPCQLPPRGMENVLLPEGNTANRKIVGLLGCSTELIRLISCISQLRALMTDQMPTCLASETDYRTTDLALVIHKRLLHLEQDIYIHAGEMSGTICHTRITLTAELYRIAALLYLYQTVPPCTLSDNEARGHIQDGFAVLDQMEICSSPWPLFIMAITVSDDRDRIKIMGFLVDGARKRQIGNYAIIANLVEAVWKQQDLAADEKEDRKVDWRDVVSGNGGMPSFI